MFLVLPWLTKELTGSDAVFISPSSVLGAGPALAICSPASVKRAMAWVRISQAIEPGPGAPRQAQTW